MYLDINQLSGHIPRQLGYLENLEELWLWKRGLGQLLLLGYSNQLSGHIPQELGYLENVDLDLSNNTLTGSIPKHLSNITNISQFFLDNNQLFGDIPRELGYLVNLEILFLDNNQLFDQTFFLFRANMAHNDEACGSGKQFWELSQ